MSQFFFSEKKEIPQNRVKIANVSEVAEGSTKVFFYPGVDDVDRSFLVRARSDCA